jgi:hypothetical protein
MRWIDNSDIDIAMEDLKKGMLLLRRNNDSDSILYWEALLEVNRTLAMEDTERALGYLKELLKMHIPESRFEFHDVYIDIMDAYKHIRQSGRSLEYMQSIVATIERKYGIKLSS